ncbi:hypothetical protein SDC9_71582 [bioreactor metagenome]|uniref:Uncharacterized protein n=1 Tax=bioreactor metagenome TaxID=1076179 RepID=A0A644Y8Y8_9ZZZZ
MVFGFQLSFNNEFVLQFLNDIAFFGMDGQHSTVVAQTFHHFFQLGIIQTDGVPVCQIYFKRSDVVLLNALSDFFGHGVVPPGDAHMEFQRNRAGNGFVFACIKRLNQ